MRRRAFFALLSLIATVGSGRAFTWIVGTRHKNQNSPAIPQTKSTGGTVTTARIDWAEHLQVLGIRIHLKEFDRIEVIYGDKQLVFTPEQIWRELGGA